MTFFDKQFKFRLERFYNLPIIIFIGQQHKVLHMRLIIMGFPQISNAATCQYRDASVRCNFNRIALDEVSHTKLYVIYFVSNLQQVEGLTYNLYNNNSPYVLFV
jgi:hypothetical protein